MGWPNNEQSPIWKEVDPNRAPDSNTPVPPVVNPPANENDTNFKQLADGFIRKPNRIILKRDSKTTNHPCPADLAVGELALNAVTGNLYTKLVTGRIVMYKPNSVCDLNQISMDYGLSLVVPETCEDICSVSGYGITFTSKARNSLRFNPVALNEGLPTTYNIKYTSVSGTTVLIGRISAISDYKSDMSFEILYYPDPDSTNFYPLSGKFGKGIYDNGNLGSITLETV